MRFTWIALCVSVALAAPTMVRADDEEVASSDAAEISLSYAPALVRIPINPGKHDLAYGGDTRSYLGLDLGLAKKKVHRSSSSIESYVFYHATFDVVSTTDGAYRGYRIAPLGLGYWFVPHYPLQIGVIGNALHVEHMAGTDKPVFATQSTTALGMGLHLYGGVLLLKGNIELGIMIGVDTRFISFQDAGIATGWGPDFVVRPMIGWQGW